MQWIIECALDANRRPSLRSTRNRLCQATSPLPVLLHTCLSSYNIPHYSAREAVHTFSSGSCRALAFKADLPKIFDHVLSRASTGPTAIAPPACAPAPQQGAPLSSSAEETASVLPLTTGGSSSGVSLLFRLPTRRAFVSQVAVVRLMLVRGEVGTCCAWNEGCASSIA